VLAGAGDGLVGALAAYGRELGTAFQLVDDLLGIWGDPAVTGKPVFSDLRSRKKSLPVTYALGNGGDAGRRLAGWLATPPLADRDESDVDDLRAAAELVEAGGGRAWAAVEAARRLDLAADALRRVAMPTGPCEELLALGHFIVEREA
jgi:geranylgeranyl diphosphate synthase, type I